MRTTIDIADDVLAAAKERAKRENRTAGDVVSDLLRLALTLPPQPSPSAVREPTAVYGFRPFAPSGAIVTNALVDELREDGAD